MPFVLQPFTWPFTWFSQFSTRYEFIDFGMILLFETSQGNGVIQYHYWVNINGWGLAIMNEIVVFMIPRPVYTKIHSVVVFGGCVFSNLASA